MVNQAFGNNCLPSGRRWATQTAVIPIAGSAAEVTVMGQAESAREKTWLANCLTLRDSWQLTCKVTFIEQHVLEVERSNDGSDSRSVLRI